MSNPVTYLRREIAEQPEIVRRLAGAGEAALAVAARIRARRVHTVLFVARGTSRHTAIYGQYLAGVLVGLPSGLLLPSVLTLYGRRLRMRDTLVIAISQSGETPEVIKCLAGAREQGALTVAVTNEADSPLGAVADELLVTAAGNENAVAATKTYTSQLAMLALLFASWSRDQALLTALSREVPEAMAQALALEGEIEALAHRWAEHNQLLVIARGFNEATAMEAALKVQETASIAAVSYSAAEFLHGPISMVGPGLGGLVFIMPGPTAAGLRGVALTLEDRGVDAMLVAPPEIHVGRLPALRLARGIPEALTTLPAIIPAQLLAFHLASLRGLDPDHPRGLSKVTRTE
ncbi:MAG TPA: SIS domain-containing protein [Candidatus Saccharimonadales bacterium]|nr:SIS domain-containing protein [Candidatus Saccharimonadales bacterium]